MIKCRVCGQKYYSGGGYNDTYCTRDCDLAASKQSAGIMVKGLFAIFLITCVWAAWSSGHWWGYPLAIAILVLGGKMMK